MHEKYSNAIVNLEKEKKLRGFQCYSWLMTKTIYEGIRKDLPSLMHAVHLVTWVCQTDRAKSDYALILNLIRYSVELYKKQKLCATRYSMYYSIGIGKITDTLVYLVVH